MIYFQPIRTARLDVQLRELEIMEAVDLAALPLGKHEVAVDALLRGAIKEAKGPHSNPGRWTVQERWLVMAHYLAAASDEGGNFSVGEGRFLDYLHPLLDKAPESVVAGEAGGNEWSVRQLTGDAALALEGLCTRRIDWLMGDMAARLTPLGSDEPPAPDPTDEPHAYTEWLTAQKALVEKLPESDFVALFAVYQEGLRQLHHLFTLDFDAEGHIFLAKPRPQSTEGGVQSLAPARFPVSACYSEIASYLGA